MAFRTTYSRVSNEPAFRLESSLDMAIVIAGQRVGRIQGFSSSGQPSPRPAIEIGSDRVVEFIQGIKMYQGRIQSMTLRYGDLVKRLASLSGGVIDGRSQAATLTNMPEFDIALFRRGNAGEPAPQLLAPNSASQDLSGSGGLVKMFIGCVIDSFDQAINAQDSMIMENVSVKYVDVIQG